MIPYIVSTMLPIIHIYKVYVYDLINSTLWWYDFQIILRQLHELHSKDMKRGHSYEWLRTQEWFMNSLFCCIFSRGGKSRENQVYTTKSMMKWTNYNESHSNNCCRITFNIYKQININKWWCVRLFIYIWMHCISYINIYIYIYIIIIIDIFKYIYYSLLQYMYTCVCLSLLPFWLTKPTGQLDSWQSRVKTVKFYRGIKQTSD